MNKTDIHLIVKRIADEIRVDPKVVWAIISIESVGDFEIGDGKIRILLERHQVFKHAFKFYGLNEARAMWMRCPGVCNPRAGGYGKYRDQYRRLASAVRCCGAEVAHLGTSFGAFQIMGFNHAVCGYDSAVAMSDDFHARPVDAQVEGFIKFCVAYKNGKLIKAMRDVDYQRIARIYNGRLFARNRYAKRLAIAANDWSVAHGAYVDVNDYQLALADDNENGDVI